MVDLAKIPRDEAILLNHYASGGVKDDRTWPTDDTYPYVESVLKNRELFLEFVKPEWIDKIEFHTAEGQETLERGETSAEEFQDSIRRNQHVPYRSFTASSIARP